MRSASEGSPLVHEGDSMLVPMRLQRFLARAGVASRRGSEGLMTAGRVRSIQSTLDEVDEDLEEERELISTDEDSADVGATFDGDSFDKDRDA